MARQSFSFAEFARELKRRRVYRVAAAYAVAGWLAIEVAATVAPLLAFPSWVPRVVVMLVLLGFPFALVLAWALELKLDDRGEVPARASGALPAIPRWRSPGLLALAAAATAVVGLGAGEVVQRVRTRAAPPSMVTLAVLPFHSAGSETATDFLRIGVPDAIITRLATLDRLRVRPTSAILPYQAGGFDPQEAGRALQAEYVLTGTLQETAGRIRISVQLVRVADGAPVWGEPYHLSRVDLLGLQDSVAERVTAALRIRLSQSQRERLYQAHTRDPLAYEQYLRGRSHLVRRTEDGTRSALAAFESALEHDPRYALAHAGVAMASAEIHLRYAATDESNLWADRAIRAAKRALELDPGLGEAYEAQAIVYRKTEFDWEAALDAANRALALNPSLESPHYVIATAFAHLGVPELGERAAEATTALNPTGDRVEYLRVRGMLAFWDGRAEEARRLLEEVQRSSDGPIADWNLALALHFTGERAEALSLLEVLASTPSASAQARAKASIAALVAGDEAGRAAALLDELTGGEYMDHHVAYEIATAFAQLGQPAEAIRWLSLSAETGFPCYSWFLVDPRLDAIRADPDFQKLLQQLRDSAEEITARYRLASAAP